MADYFILLSAAERQSKRITPSLPSPLPVESLRVEREGEGFGVSSLRSELRVEDSRTVRVGGCFLLNKNLIN